MAVFRVKKTRDFTVMSNHHLRNKEISLKAKGLLSVMLSLPDEWDYSLKGLANISKEEVDAIRTGIKELEKAGYIERHQIRNKKGQIEDMEYIIHEQPIVAEPILENPIPDKPFQKNPMQLNTNKSNVEELNTDVIKYPSINHEFREDGLIERYNKINLQIKEQINYDELILHNNKNEVDNIVNLMTEVMVVDIPYYGINGKNIPTELVRMNFRKITYEMMEIMLMEWGLIRYKINKPDAYLISMLYNLPITSDIALGNRINSDIYGRRDE